MGGEDGAEHFSYFYIETAHLRGVS